MAIVKCTFALCIVNIIGTYICSSVLIFEFSCVLLLIGLDDIIQKISSTPYEGNVIQARRPLVLNNSILIDHLPTQKCTKEMLDVYFTNKKRSGIDSYKEIEILDDNRAIVHLESKDGM